MYVDAQRDKVESRLESAFRKFGTIRPDMAKKVGKRLLEDFTPDQIFSANLDNSYDTLKRVMIPDHWLAVISYNAGDVITMLLFWCPCFQLRRIPYCDNARTSSQDLTVLQPFALAMFSLFYQSLFGFMLWMCCGMWLQSNLLSSTVQKTTNKTNSLKLQLMKVLIILTCAFQSVVTRTNSADKLPFYSTVQLMPSVLG